jgi:hypothetical protein
MWTSLANTALAILLAGSTGCSLVFVRGPPAFPAGADPSAAPAACTTSRAAPIVDVTLGGVASVVGLGLLVGPGSSPSSGPGLGGCVGSSAARESARTVGPILLAAGLVGAFSGAVGFQQTGQCRAAGAREP